MQRFKEFLLEDDAHNKISLEEAVIYFKENCSDYNLSKPLYRASNSENTTISKTRERQKILGGWGTVLNYINSTGYWKEYPNRNKSVFCSTTQNIMIKANALKIIIPKNNTKLAIINTKDFNLCDFKLAKINLNLNTLIACICYFGKGNDKAERFDDAMSKLNMFKHVKSSELKERIYNYSKQAKLDLDEEDLDFFIENIDRFDTLFTPKTMGVKLITTKTLNETKTKEVWFEGEYLSIPEHEFNKFRSGLLL